MSEHAEQSGLREQRDLAVVPQEQNVVQAIAISDIEAILHSLTEEDFERSIIALFGDTAEEIGLHPETYLVNQVRTEVLRRLFEIIQIRLEERGLSNLAPSIRFLVNEVGEKITIALAQVVQHRRNAQGTLKNQREAWKFAGPNERRYARDARKIERIIRRIVKQRGKLVDHLRDTLYVDKNVPQEVRDSHEYLDELKIIYTLLHAWGFLRPVVSVGSFHMAKVSMEDIHNSLSAIEAVLNSDGKTHGNLLTGLTKVKEKVGEYINSGVGGKALDRSPLDDVLDRLSRDDKFRVSAKAQLRSLIQDLERAKTRYEQQHVAEVLGG